MAANPHPFAYLFERFPSFVQTFVYREAVEMVRQGVNPWLVSVRRPDDPGAVAETISADTFYLPGEKELRTEVDARRAARKLSWRPHRAIPRHRSEADAQRMFEAIWLAPELEKRGIRHVHAHFGGLAARTAWWLKKLFGITYSFTGHANDIFCESGYPVSNAMLAKESSFIVTETDFARRWMEEHHAGVKGKVFRVFNGIDPVGFFPRAAAGPVPRILSVGRCVEKKGYDVLIEACGRLRDRGIVFQCEIVGDGPLFEKLAAQISTLQLGDQVKLAGPQSQTEVRRRLAGADCFVLACQADSEGGSDNLPTVIAEAMFTGVPCVSTTIAGVPEMITSGQDGLLVPPRDVAALTEALAGLLQDPARAAALGAAGQGTARTRFTIEQSVKELRQLLAKRGKGGFCRWFPW